MRSGLESTSGANKGGWGDERKLGALCAKGVDHKRDGYARWKTAQGANTCCRRT